LLFGLTLFAEALHKSEFFNLKKIIKRKVLNLSLVKIAIFDVVILGMHKEKKIMKMKAYKYILPSACLQVCLSP